VKTIDVELYRVIAGDHCDHNRLVARLELGQQASLAWIDLIKKSSDLGQNAHSGGIMCIKLYASVTLREAHNEQRSSVPAELEFYGDSIKIRVPKYGSTLKRLHPFESDYSAGGTITRTKLASAIKRTFLPQPVAQVGLHVY
jgi:hypothetical protein